MSAAAQLKPKRCTVYTRKSSEEGLEQAFNSLHAQREACESYIQSQKHEGWQLIPTAYDDGGFSGGNVERPALRALLDEIQSGQIDVVIVYKVDRLSRSLADFVRLIELFDKHGVSFVSVTQQFNTSNSMGRLTLNVLLSFAQFEREVTSERIRDKIAASKKKGMWMGGVVPIGFDVQDKKLVVNAGEALTVRHIYERYLALGCVRKLKTELDETGYVSKARIVSGKPSGGTPFTRGALYALLKNPLYIGKVRHGDKLYAGEHKPILEKDLWNSVQQLLKDNRKSKKSRCCAKEPSLLAGLLFDDRGNPMSPSHSQKGSRRYRYYVSQAALQYREKDLGSLIRLPAQTIEEIITNQLKALLLDPNKLHKALEGYTFAAHEQESLHQQAGLIAEKWEKQSQSQKIQALTQLLNRITIGKRKVDIRIDKKGLARLLGQSKASTTGIETQPIFEISVPVALKRCGFETRLILGDSSHQAVKAPNASVDALRIATLDALKWNEELITGKAKSMTEIAQREGVTQQYVTRILRLSLLSPRIIESIAEGDVSLALSLESLKKDFPLEWQQQEKLFLRSTAV